MCGIVVVWGGGGVRAKEKKPGQGRVMRGSEKKIVNFITPVYKIYRRTWTRTSMKVFYFFCFTFSFEGKEISVVAK